MQRHYAGYWDVDEVIGKSVTITGCDVKAYKEYDIVGLRGIIKNYHLTTSSPCVCKAFAVEIIGLTNPGSEKGLFWLAPECLNLYEVKENKTMDENTIKSFGKGAKFAILIEQGKRDVGTVGVYYGDLKSGDLVVCDYGYSNGKMSVRKVELADVAPEVTGTPDCEIIGVCDASAYYERKAKKERRAELKKQMIAQAKRYQEEEYWRLISESDTTMKTLYEEFKTLED